MLCSADEEDQPEWIDCIHDVSNEVEAGHERNNCSIIPIAETPDADAGPGVVVEAVVGPDDHSCHVHHHGQHVASCQNFVEWGRKERQKAADSENDDNQGKNEADGVDSDTPLEPWKLSVLVAV